MFDCFKRERRPQTHSFPGCTTLMSPFEDLEWIVFGLEERSNQKETSFGQTKDAACERNHSGSLFGGLTKAASLLKAAAFTSLTTHLRVGCLLKEPRCSDYYAFMMDAHVQRTAENDCWTGCDASVFAERRTESSRNRTNPPKKQGRWDF